MSDDGHTRAQDPARSVEINFNAARFIKSASCVGECPPDQGAEIALAGRSNVGKSSTLNALTNRKKLAYAGNAPGRTRLLNFFALGSDAYRLVDLPGYGYARVSQKERQAWQRLIERYVFNRRSLRGICLLTDARHPMHDSDWQFLGMTGEAGMPVHVILNRADKLKSVARRSAVDEVRASFARSAATPRPVEIQLFSATKRIGLDELHAGVVRMISARATIREDA